MALSSRRTPVGQGHCEPEQRLEVSEVKSFVKTLCLSNLTKWRWDGSFGERQRREDPSHGPMWKEWAGKLRPVSVATASSRSSDSAVDKATVLAQIPNWSMSASDAESVASTSHTEGAGATGQTKVDFSKTVMTPQRQTSDCSTQDCSTQGDDTDEPISEYENVDSSAQSLHGDTQGERLQCSGVVSEMLALQSARKMDELDIALHETTCLLQDQICTLECLLKEEAASKAKAEQEVAEAEEEVSEAKAEEETVADATLETLAKAKAEEEAKTDEVLDALLTITDALVDQEEAEAKTKAKAQEEAATKLKEKESTATPADSALALASDVSSLTLVPSASALTLRSLTLAPSASAFNLAYGTSALNLFAPGASTLTLASGAFALGPADLTNATTITFSLLCQTRIGEEIRVVGNVATLGHWNPSNGAKMQSTDNQVWETTVDVELSSAAPLEYKYVMMCNGQVKAWEECDTRVLRQMFSGSSLEAHNIWADPKELHASVSLEGLQDIIPEGSQDVTSYTNRPPSLCHLSSAIAETEVPRLVFSPRSTTVTFMVACQTQFGEEIRIVGNAAELGHWDPSNAAKMQWTEGHLWVTTVEIELSSNTWGNSLQYKYVMMRNGQVKAWEACKNRALRRLPSASQVVCCSTTFGETSTTSTPWLSLAAHDR